MGLGSDILPLLQSLVTHGYVPRGAAVAELGAQQLSNGFLKSRGELDELASSLGVAVPCDLPEPLAAKGVTDELLSPDAPRAERFWRWLGFSYASIDIDGSPGSIPLDLNFDNVPASEREKYNLVTNFGTTEHVANQLNAFEVVHDLTAPDGVMIHHVPAQGMFNHGLVNYNPKFFWMLARSNGYRVLHADFWSAGGANPLPANVLDHVASYAPAARDRLADFSAADCMLLVVLKKTYSIEFVAPLDVNTGTRTDNAVLSDRYWTVFTPNAFAGLVQNARPSVRQRVKRLLSRRTAP